MTSRKSPPEHLKARNQENAIAGAQQPGETIQCARAAARLADIHRAARPPSNAAATIMLPLGWQMFPRMYHSKPCEHWRAFPTANPDVRRSAGCRFPPHILRSSPNSRDAAGVPRCLRIPSPSTMYLDCASSVFTR
jgi:hypothetical protein